MILEEVGSNSFRNGRPGFWTDFSGISVVPRLERRDTEAENLETSLETTVVVQVGECEGERKSHFRGRMCSDNHYAGGRGMGVGGEEARMPARSLARMMVWCDQL